MPVRLRSLDVFRGVVILLMIVVNNGGGDVSYTWLEHSPWDGWTLADTVFPAFLWIMGVAITMSRRKSPAKIVWRATVLFALGVALYIYPTMSWSHERIFGVLQRIAICYCLIALLNLYTGVRTQIAAIVLLLGIYWLLMTQVAVPGYGAGRLDMEGNFAHYVDWVVLGTHNYARTKTWDPEGIVSTLPALATTLLGVTAGRLLRFNGRRRYLVYLGACLVAAGQVWSIWMPINKKIWSDSFALFMAGLDCLALAGLDWLVEETKGAKYLRPFLITGMNAIAVYLGAEVLQGLLDLTGLHAFLYANYLAPIATPQNASLLWALAVTTLMYGFAYLLYRRQWFWRI